MPLTADYASVAPWDGLQNKKTASTTDIGCCPQLPGDATLFLNGEGEWATPPGSGGTGGTLKSAIYPTYSIPGGSEATIPVLDLAGQTFLDINGKSQKAIARIAIMATNFANATDYIIQKKGSTINNGPGVLAVLARTSVYVPTYGDYSVSNGGGVNNLIISEIYNVS